MIILLSCLREYIDNTFETNIRSHSIHLCKFFYFACYFFSTISSYLNLYIAQMTWRSLTSSVYKKRNQERNLKRNKTKLAVIFMGCFLVCLPFLYFPTLTEIIKPDLTSLSHLQIQYNCELSKDGLFFLSIIDSTLFCFIPLFLCFLFSFLTTIRLFRRKKYFRTIWQYGISNAS